MSLKKAVRSLQVEFPALLELKFDAMRAVRNSLRVPFERDFRALPLLNAPEGAEFLDIGANRGQSIDAMRMMCPAARVRAFEPNGELFDRLRVRYAGEPWLQLENYGLGAAESEATLYVPFYKRWMFDGLASFDESEARGWLPSRIYFYSDRHLRVQASRCRVRRLDDLNLQPFFVKIDVQGFELEVLRGGRNTLQRYQPALLVEAPGEPILRFLEELGYRPYAFVNGCFASGVRGGLNTFFLTQAAERRLPSGAMA